MGNTERYLRPSDLPSRIPVFPLRGAILLPRATLPLNVFEPRYLSMIDDVLAGSRVLGIVQPAGAGRRKKALKEKPASCGVSGASGASPSSKSVTTDGY